MKKTFKKIAIITLVLFLTGCVKYEAKTEIKKDKSLDLSIIYAMEISDEYQEEQTEQINPDDYKDLTNKGYKVEEYKNKLENKEQRGVKITKTFDNIDNYSKTEEVKFYVTSMVDEENKNKYDDQQLFSKKGNTYKANFLFDLTSEEQEDDMIDLDQMSKLFDMKYILVLPVKPTTHNATTISEDGLTLTWELPFNKLTEAKFEFTLKSQLISGIDNNYLYIGGGLFVFLVLAIVLISGGGKKENNGLKEETPVEQPKEKTIEEVVEETSVDWTAMSDKEEKLDIIEQQEYVEPVKEEILDIVEEIKYVEPVKEEILDIVEEPKVQETNPKFIPPILNEEIKEEAPKKSVDITSDNWWEIK